jgi:hypothetical protein
MSVCLLQQERRHTIGKIDEIEAFWRGRVLQPLGPQLRGRVGVFPAQGRRVSRTEAHIRKGGHFEVESLGIPMEHDPLRNSDNGFLRLIQGRQLRLNGVVGIRHGGHSQMLSYIWALLQGCCSAVLHSPSRDDELGSGVVDV